MADFSDGVQLDELRTLTPDPAAGIGAGVIFHFSGRELGTGRYHPMLLQLRNDGTGTLQNAANSGGINPVTMMEVNVANGEEYITALTFTPSAVTFLTGAVIPEPSRGMLLGLATVPLLLRRLRR